MGSSAIRIVDALPRAVVRDPIKGDFEHLDLLLVSRGEKVTVNISINVIGDAAPVSVPGDIAATSAERRMKNPADAAREPVGETNVTTGTGDAKIFAMICRIDVSSPPGVSIVISTNDACSCAARSIPFEM